MTKDINMQCKGVTIGIPVYNEERYIEAAIRSAAPQCEAVCISDNASNDNSAAICEGLSREYTNVFFDRQQHNIGASANFKYLLYKANTPFFMWLGGHDMIPKAYVAQLKQLLEFCPEAVLSYGAVRHVNLDGSDVRRYDYYFSHLLADNLPTVRLMGLIRYLSNCSLVHGLFRTEVLRSAWVSEKYIGLDHVLLSKASLKGRFIYAPETYLIRRDALPDDTLKDQLERVTGQISNERQLSYREMQRQQYTIAVELSGNDGWAALWFRLKIRFFLVERFGTFDENRATNMLCELIKFLRRFWRLAKRIFRSVESQRHNT